MAISSDLLEHPAMSDEYPATEDPLVKALQRLLAAEGGHIAVADKTGISDQSLYQIATCRPDSKSGKLKSVGPKIRRALTAAYPNWLTQSSPVSAAEEKDTALHLGGRQLPPISAALDVVLDALSAAPARDKLRTAVMAVLEDDSPQYRQRLAELITPSPAVLPEPPRPQLASHRQQVSRPNFKPPGLPAEEQTPPVAAPRES
jgi:hypothetical protein